MKLLRTTKIIGLALLAGGASQAAAIAGEGAAGSSTNLVDLSLEQLINLQVTSVSKKETSLNQAPAAIFVVTPEDIDRLGVTSLPEALRLVPGMDVAQVNSSQWAVSSRGFNTQFANKMLVLVDGRSVYTPGFGGVIWELQDAFMEDLDRIEVIRGPGATLWGANAVNGVINIMSKSAKDTQGLLVSAGEGNEFQPVTGVRYGGALSTNLFYRAFFKYAQREGFSDTAGNGEPDDRNLFHGGARLDWEPGLNDRFTLQGDYISGNFGGIAQSASLTPPTFMSNFSGINNKSAYNTLGRWTHDFSEASQVSLQLYHDHSVDTDGQIKSTLDVYDIDLQHRFPLGDRQDIVWGAGARYQPDDNPPSFDLTFTPQKSYDQVYNLFLQDDLTVIQDRVHFILGTKLEQNSDTGFEYEPSGRLLWTPTEKNTIWAAVSRAVRTPARTDQDSRFNQAAFPGVPPTLVSLYGTNNFRSEKLLAYELGYRVEPMPKLSLDAAAFYNDYDRLETYVSGAPFLEGGHVVVPQLETDGSWGDSYGAELSAQWRVTDDWKLMASYSYLHISLHNPIPTAGSDPEHQFQIHSYLNLTRNVELNASLFYVDRLPSQNIPAHVRTDLGVVWRPAQAWEIGVWGQNLFDNRHPEFNSVRTPAVTEVPRSVLAKVTWRF